MAADESLTNTKHLLAAESLQFKMRWPGVMNHEFSITCTHHVRYVIGFR